MTVLVSVVWLLLAWNWYKYHQDQFANDSATMQTSEDTSADAGLQRHHLCTLLLLVTTEGKRRQHIQDHKSGGGGGREGERVKRERDKRARGSNFPARKTAQWYTAANWAANSWRYIWKQEWINKELEQPDALKSLKGEPPLAARGRGRSSKQTNRLIWFCPSENAQEQIPSLKV